MLDVIDTDRTVFNVITKSGSTSETMAQLLIITRMLIDRYGDVPRAVEGLIEVAKLRRIAQKMHLTEIIQSGDVMIFYPEKTDKKTMERVSAVGGKFGKDMMLNIATDKPNFRVNGTDKHGGPLALLADTLAAMQSIDKENVTEEGENNG